MKYVGQISIQIHIEEDISDQEASERVLAIATKFKDQLEADGHRFSERVTCDRILPPEVTLADSAQNLH
jgi:hypothetical protein